MIYLVILFLISCLCPILLFILPFLALVAYCIINSVGEISSAFKNASEKESDKSTKDTDN